LKKDTTLETTEWNTKYQGRNEKAGFDIVDGDSMIVPVMLYDAAFANRRQIYKLFVISSWYQG
jgi:hypothetical protein